MLKSSRTWPSILTMAVVQLKFDRKGKYSYSTIANINQSQLIESHAPFHANGHSVLDSEQPQLPSNGVAKKDSAARKNAKAKPISANNCLHTSHTTLSGATSPNQNGKVCLCELKFCDKRSRSESIKVDNWDYIYKENSFRVNRDQLRDDLNAIPK